MKREVVISIVNSSILEKTSILRKRLKTFANNKANMVEEEAHENIINNKERI